MHIEPGVVDGAKILLSYATAAGALGLVGKVLVGNLRESGIPAIIARSALSTALVFVFFEVLPHQPVGVRKSISFWDRPCSSCSGPGRPRSAWRWAY